MVDLNDLDGRISIFGFSGTLILPNKINNFLKNKQVQQRSKLNFNNILSIYNILLHQAARHSSTDVSFYIRAASEGRFLTSQNGNVEMSCFALVV